MKINWPSRDLVPDLIAGAGTTIAFLFGSAGGFEHTVTLARRNGTGAYWDIVTAICVEVLAVTGTAMWLAFNRRGWPTWYPLTLVVLGVLGTFGAQMGYRAAPEPNEVIGYITAGTPTAIALLLVLGGHFAHGYSHSVPAVAIPEPVAELASLPVPAQVSVPEPVEVFVPEAIPVPVPVPEVKVQSVRTPKRVAASVPDAPVVEDEDQADQVARVRALPRSAKTGRPTVKTVRDEFKIGQAKAQTLINKAFEGQEEEEAAGGEESGSYGEVMEGQDHLWESKEEEAKEESVSHTIATLLIKENPEPADAVEEPVLQLVGGR